MVRRRQGERVGEKCKDGGVCIASKLHGNIAHWLAFSTLSSHLMVSANCKRLGLVKRMSRGVKVTGTICGEGRYAGRT